MRERKEEREGGGVRGEEVSKQKRGWVARGASESRGREGRREERRAAAGEERGGGEREREEWGGINMQEGGREREVGGASD